MAFTFAQLKTAIQEYTENTETTFVTNVDDFIRSAEDRIFYLVDLEYFRKNATSAVSQNDPFLSLPTDFLASFSLSITNSSSKEFLLKKDVNFIQEFNPNSATTGTPKIQWGGNADGRYPEFIFKATALPSNAVVET